MATDAAHPLVLGVAGGSGSGKTTLAKVLVEALSPCPLIDHDSYYRDQADRSMAEREQVNYDHPDALDNDLLCDHLAAFRAGQLFEKPRYEFATHSRAEPGTPVEPAPLAVVEGILVLAHPGVRARMDLRIFVDTPEAVRRHRRLDRDVRERGRDPAHVEWQFDHHVQPMHARHVQPSAAHADLVVSGEDPARANAQRVLDALAPWGARLDPRQPVGVGTRLCTAPEGPLFRRLAPHLPPSIERPPAPVRDLRLGAPRGPARTEVLIESSCLAARWPDLDRAAGPDLVRRLALAEREDGRAVAAWTYVAR